MIFIFILALAFSLTACENSFSRKKFKIGEQVTNGLCYGYVVDIGICNLYKIMPFTCKEVQFDFVWIKEEELKSLEK